MIVGDLNATCHLQLWPEPPPPFVKPLRIVVEEQESQKKMPTFFSEVTEERKAVLNLMPSCT